MPPDLDKSLKDRRFTDSNGNEWRVKRVFRHHICAAQVHPSYGKEKTFTQTDMDGVRWHTLPDKIKVGDLLIYHGQPITVNGFDRYGNQPMVLLVGYWGGDSVHENAYPLYRGLICEGIRSPHEGEISEDAATLLREAAREMNERSKEVK